LPVEIFTGFENYSIVISNYFFLSFINAIHCRTDDIGGVFVRLASGLVLLTSDEPYNRQKYGNVSSTVSPVYILVVVEICLTSVRKTFSIIYENILTLVYSLTANPQKCTVFSLLNTGAFLYPARLELHTRSLYQLFFFLKVLSFLFISQFAHFMFYARTDAFLYICL